MFLLAAQTACKLMKLHASSWNFLQAHGTNCMVAYVTACRLMELHAILCIALEPCVTFGPLLYP